KVFVGNLSYDTTWKGLKDHFARAGNVEYAEVLEGPNGRSKGIGIVRFGTEEEALAAIDELTETDLDGREIFRLPSSPCTRQVRADRGGSAGKGGGGRGGGKGKGGGKAGRGGRGGGLAAGGGPGGG
ncbi:RNA-binding protein, partial [Emiliania huxleyi CCMP1516]|uniref:RRM domain-containing protein n=2 Tax=Emiliania huxleyi TaxID=2903 RepID=A0A0D3I8C1_EMIH1